DRKDEPSAEAVVVAGSVLPRDDQPRPEERLDRKPVLPRGAEEVVPALGRVPEPEGARDVAADPAPVEVLAGPLGLGAVPEPRFEPAGGPLGEPEQPVAGPRFPGAFAIRQGDANPLGQEADRFGELEPIVPAQEFEGVAPRVAPEAVKEVELRVDREGRCLLLVERTQALPALAGTLERHDR